MRKTHDFYIKVNSQTTGQDVSNMLIERITLRRLKYNKPSVMFIGGASGEGKSMAGLYIQQTIMGLLGLQLEDYLETINVFTPVEYPKKIHDILYNPLYKKIRIICIHEARELVSAKNWQGFVERAVSAIGVLSRSIKPLVIIIVSQSISDITKELRRALTYYCTVWRPAGKQSRLYLNLVWQNDKNMEKPMLDKRKLIGKVYNEDTGVTRMFFPKYIEFPKVRPEIYKRFNELDTGAKSAIIQMKINKQLEAIQAEMGLPSQKIQEMVEYYIKNPDQLSLIGKQRKGKLVIGSSFKKMYSLTDPETEEFHAKLNDALAKGGLLAKTEGESDEN